jgi:hypothetical protein
MLRSSASTAGGAGRVQVRPGDERTAARSYVQRRREVCREPVTDGRRRRALGTRPSGSPDRAAFDPTKTLEGFDFSFNPKLNKAQVFDLATASARAAFEAALITIEANLTLNQ